MESLNLKKLLNQFLDWKITFTLHCGKDLLTNLYKPFLKFKENVPKYRRTTNCCWYNLLRDIQFVKEHFDTLINNINRVVVTFGNTSQEVYFYMNIFHTRTNFEKSEQKHVN